MHQAPRPHSTPLYSYQARPVSHRAPRSHRAPTSGRTYAVAISGTVLAVLGAAALSAGGPASADGTTRDAGNVVASQWPGGFTAGVTVTRLGGDLSSWRVTWDYGSGQQITQPWNASVTQVGTLVAVTGLPGSGRVHAGATISFGF